MPTINIRMYNVTHYDDQVPHNIHKAAYDYLQTLNWQAKYRHVPDSSINPSEATTDLVPYVTKKTVYRSVFSNLDDHAPIADLFDFINNKLFDNKFELNGKQLGLCNFDNVPSTEYDDYNAEREHKGNVAFMTAEPYETIKRTRVPYRDWDNTPLDSDEYYTIVFIANLNWNPVWHSEMFFFEDDEADIGDAFKFLNNIPGRVVAYDSRVLHNAKPTSVLATELAQRIEFRVKLKDGETFV